MLTSILCGPYGLNPNDGFKSVLEIDMGHVKWEDGCVRACVCCRGCIHAHRALRRAMIRHYYSTLSQNLC